MPFTCFTTPPETPQLTMKQRVAALSDQAKTDILKEYIKDTKEHVAEIRLGIPLDLVKYIYDKIDELQERSRLYTRGEVIITPAVSHMENGVEIIDTPAVYNTPPIDIASLKAFIKPEFQDDFPIDVFAAVVKAMFDWTKYDGSGTFAFYKSQITL